MFTKDLGIDLGTMFTRLADSSQVLSQEPTIVVIEVADLKMVAVGQEARDMYGRVPETMEVTRPLQSGVIADYEVTEYLLQALLRRLSGPVRFFHSAGMGGVELRKGTDILVRAFQQVTGNAQLIIHSQVGLDRYASVASLIHNDPRIEFIEATVGAPGLYHLGDVYVYPSRLEGIGLTIAEALACGLPVITTDCAPMNEFVQKDFNGKLVSIERYEQL